MTTFELSTDKYKRPRITAGFSYDVIDAEPIHREYHSTKFRPTTASVFLTWTDAGWEVEEVRVHGPAITSKGKDHASQRGTATYRGHAVQHRRTLADAPEWVQSVAVAAMDAAVAMQSGEPS